jgi:6-phosphogluconate dehydrogenase
VRKPADLKSSTLDSIGRFLNGGEKGRFVPPEVVMGKTKEQIKEANQTLAGCALWILV